MDLDLLYSGQSTWLTCCQPGFYHMHHILEPQPFVFPKQANTIKQTIIIHISYYNHKTENNFEKFRVVTVLLALSLIWHSYYVSCLGVKKIICSLQIFLNLASKFLILLNRRVVPIPQEVAFQYPVSNISIVPFLISKKP